MVLSVRLDQAFRLYMRIDFRCAYIGMAQQELHGTQVSAAFQKMRGKGMAEGVR